MSTTYRNFYAVVEEDDGTVTLEIQVDPENVYETATGITPDEAERLAFDLIAAARRQKEN